MIPNEAGVVIILNGQSLTNKLPWDEIKQNAVFAKMNADTSVPAYVKMIADNPEKAGIDIKNDVDVFMIKDTSGMYIGIEGLIKDMDKFRLFNLDLTKNGFESEKGSIKTITSYPVIVGYNKERFVYVIDKHNTGPINFKTMTDTITDKTPKMNSPSRDLAGTCESIFNLSEKNSLGSNEEFTSLVNKKADIYCWFNVEQLSKGSLGGVTGGLLNMDKMYEGNVTTATVNFDNGKINVDLTSYAGKEMTAIWKKYEGSAFNQDMVKMLPSKEVAALFALNFKPEGIREMVKTMGMEGILNLGLAFAGFTMDDFIKANKGDILFAVTDIKMKPDSSSKPDILFAASVSDKDAMNVLIKAGKKMSSDKLGDSAQLPISYNTNGKYFVMSNSKEKADKFLEGGNNSFDFLSKISGKPFGGFVDFQYILKAIPDGASDSSKKVVYDASLKMWDNLYYKGGNYSDGGLSQTIEINLMDKNTNSLKQLNQYGAILALLAEEKKRKNEVRNASMPNNRNDSMIPVKPVHHIHKTGH